MLFSGRLYLFIIIVIGIIAPAYAKTPDWVKQRPVDPAYYIGIGVAVKTGDGKEYLQSAKQAALSDLASEITVNISSELIDIAVEQSGLSEEQVRQEIRTTTAAELEGYELIDTYENTNEYWVYYRLSRATYAANKQKRIDNAVNLAMNLYDKGQQQLKNRAPAGALGLFLEAFKPIQGYFTEPLETTYQGEQIYVKNEIYAAVQSILGQIQFSGTPEKTAGKLGQPLSKTLEVQAEYVTSSNRRVPVANLPLHFQFVRGEGELIEYMHTNSQGRARCRVAKITGQDQLQMVTASLNLQQLVPLDSTNAVIQGLIAGIAVPSQRFILEIKGLTAFIDAKESNFGKPLSVSQLEPAIKNALMTEGFSFVDKMNDADLVITVMADSRKGAEVYGQYVAYVDVSLSVLDMNTGQEIYKDRLSDIKGIHLDYSHAGLKAYERAGETMTTEIIPSIITQVKK